MKSQLKKKLRSFVGQNMIDIYNGSNVYRSTYDDQNQAYEFETTFRSSSGIEVPVYTNYRYKTKPGWEYYGPISALNDLNKKGLLKEEDQFFLKKAIGERTLTVSLDQAYEVLNKYQKQYPEIFLVGDIPPLGKRLLKPDIQTIEEELSSKISDHKSMLEDIKYKKSSNSQKSQKILEIGYTSGGTSIIAFERLGFEAHGIDYFFNQRVEQTSRHDYIKQLVHSNVNYHVGDITKQTLFDDNSFDIVYSNSVIEHILDLDGAFQEIFRILKNGGLFISYYGSFHFPGGGHSPGELDSPWAHVRLPKDDYYEYIKILRPFEADIAIEWIENALCPEYTISYVQRKLIQSGFSIDLWRNQKIPNEQLSDLNEHIMRDCFNNIPDLTIEDLTTNWIFFVAKKNE